MGDASLHANEAGRWLAKAREDLEMAELALAGLRSHLTHALFLSQQAAEKAMKAVFVLHGEVPPRTHDLELLADRCLVLEPTLRAAFDPCVMLSEYAVAARYPDWEGEPDHADGERAVNVARAAYEAALKLAALPEEIV